MKRFHNPLWYILPQLLVGVLAFIFVYRQFPVEKPVRVAPLLLTDWREKLILWESVIIPVAIFACLYNRKRSLSAWTVTCILFLSGTIISFVYLKNVRKDCICDCLGYSTRIGRVLNIQQYSGIPCEQIIQGKSCNTFDENYNKNIWTTQSMTQCENDLLTGFILTNLLTSLSVIFLLQVLLIKIRPKTDEEKAREKNFYHGKFYPYRRIKNIFKTGRYSFKISGLQKTDGLLIPDLATTISGTVRNNGASTGTVYVVVKIAHTFDQSKIYLDSNTALTHNNRESLRLAGILFNKEDKFTINWIPNETMQPGPLSISVEVWTPARQFITGTESHRSVYLFDKTRWLSYAVLLNKNEFENVEVFISYSMHNEAHSAWVGKLYEQLLRYNIRATFNQRDVAGGEDFHIYMADSINKTRVFILVCSSEFVKKANEKSGAVGIEVNLMLEKFPNDRSKNFIPVYRDNAKKELPADFKTLHSINMEGDNCFSVPLTDLVLSIRNKKEQNLEN